MCGILAVLSKSHRLSECIEEAITKVLVRRGPDVSGVEELELSDGYNLHLESWVLHLRGTDPTSQPYVSTNGDILQWNGDVFGGLLVGDSECDTVVLSEELAKCQGDDDVCRIMSRIQGPWSIVFYQKSPQKLWFGRDYFGRRSLLWRYDGNEFALSSVAMCPEVEKDTDWQEVAADGLYCIDLRKLNNAINVECYPWTSITNNSFSKREIVNCFDQKGTNSLLDKFCQEGTFGSMMCPPIQPFVTSAGGVDSLECNESGSPASRLSVTSSNGQGHAEIGGVGSPPIRRFVTPTDGKVATDEQTLLAIGDEKSIWGMVDGFIKVLGDAVQKRVSKVPLRNGGKSSIGVLFSGGIDCSVIALLADRFIPTEESIDLLNVAFERKNKNNVEISPHGKTRLEIPPESEKKLEISPDSKNKFEISPESENKLKISPESKKKLEISSCGNYNVPDRTTGLQSLSELQRLCPNRKWNFIEIDITIDELQSKRRDTITHLTYPLTSVLDDSIGCAVWFATRGSGFVPTGDERHPYTCDAKVLLCGMGADEQLGGYSRHRSAFERRGWAGVANEIKMEIERISSRNLGRDNRVVAHHSRDARLPYLDENVVSFLNQTPLQYKVDFNYKRGIGEKLLLRATAYKLGLKGAALLPKRAIQFGSRIAKAECRKEKASDVCGRLTVQ